MPGHGSRPPRRLSRGITLAALALAACASLGVPASSPAAAIIVETNADHFIDDSTCAVREAVVAANDNLAFFGCAAGEAVSEDVISLPGGTITLTGNPLDFEAGGPVRVTGEGDESTGTLIDANDGDRAVRLRPDGGGPVDVVLADVAIEDGNVPGNDSDGGAILVDDPDAALELRRATIRSSHAGRYGGAVSFVTNDENAALLVLETELVGNTAGDDGGALYLKNPTICEMEVTNSLLAGNSADGVGGAIYEVGAESGDGTCVTVRNSTLSGNSAAKGGGGLGTGAFPLQAHLFFATIAGNSTPMAGRGGGIQIDSDTHQMALTGTIVAGNTAAGASANCASLVGAFEPDEAVYSIESGDSCGLDTSPSEGNLVNTDPLLAPLAANGGETRTHGLYDESPARNRVPVIPTDFCFESGGVDQRGTVRGTEIPPVCDVGAFEGSVGPAPPPPPPPPTPIRCGGRVATKVGTAGPELLIGTGKPDVIAALAGNDTVRGRAGNDVLCGGKGRDRLLGGRGRDRLLGQAGRDRLRGGPGRDILRGGPGRDRQVQ